MKGAVGPGPSLGIPTFPVSFPKDVGRRASLAPRVGPFPRFLLDVIVLCFMTTRQIPRL